MVSPEFQAVVSVVTAVLAIFSVIVTISLSLSSFRQNRVNTRKTAYDLLREENDTLIKKNQELTSSLIDCNKQVDGLIRRLGRR